MAHERIEVLLADNSDLMLELTRRFLTRAGHINVVGEATQLSEVFARAEALRPDVIIIDNYLITDSVPPANTMTVIQRLREQNRTAAIVVVGMLARKELNQATLNRAGNGFIQRTEMGKYLLDAIHQVHSGKPYVSPGVRQALEDPEA